MRKHIIGGLALLLTATTAPIAAEAANLIDVDCGIGETITDALDAAAMSSDADVITVDGTCAEGLITIRINDVTIQGGVAGATIIGQFHVDAAQRVVIQNLTIQNGAEGPAPEPFSGVSAANGSAVTVANVLIESIAGRGVFLYRGATVILEDSRIQGTDLAVEVSESSFLLVRGGLITGNQRGIFVTVGSSARVFGATIEHSGETGVFIDQTSAGFVENSIIQHNGDAGILIISESHGHLFSNMIQENAGNGIQIELGSSVSAGDSTIQNNGGVGMFVGTGASAAVNAMTIENNGGIGIYINGGSYGTVSNSTIQNNGDDGAVGVLVGYSSTAQLEDNTIVGKAEGVGLEFSSSAFLRNNQITATTSDDAALDMSQGSVARLAGDNILTASPDGFSIFLQQGSTLMQRTERDTANGPVWIRSESNVELRNIEITGNVLVEDHSLLRLRDLTGDSHVTVRGNTTVSLDSGLNFIGSFPVKVVGNINCLDQESSVGKGTLSLTGKLTCTGY